jgi:hypothetical protein
MEEPCKSQDRSDSGTPPAVRLRHMAPIPTCTERRYSRMAMVPGDNTVRTSIHLGQHTYPFLDTGVFALTAEQVTGLMEALAREDTSFLRTVTRTRAYTYKWSIQNHVHNACRCGRFALLSTDADVSKFSSVSHSTAHWSTK